MSLTFRRASTADATGIATLHADSWRRHYRGAYSDSFLDGDVLEQNIEAQAFYRAFGGTCAEMVAVSPSGGDSSRLNGAANKLRMTWAG